MNERNKKQRQMSQGNVDIQQITKPISANAEGTWKENLGKYFIDISKYVMTGVIITSIFNDLEDKSVIYIIGIVVALIALIVGLILTNKKKGN